MNYKDYPLTVIWDIQKLSEKLHQLAETYLNLIELVDDEKYIITLKDANHPKFFFRVGTPIQDNNHQTRFSLNFFPQYEYSLQSGASFNLPNEGIIEQFGRWVDILKKYELAKNYSSGAFNIFNDGSSFSNSETINSAQSGTHFLNKNYVLLNQPFNEAEKVQIKNGIDELKVKINLIELDIQTKTAINEKLDQLFEKVEELNKFDWKSLFAGTIASLILTFCVPPEAAGLIWFYIKNAFNGLRLK